MVGETRLLSELSKLVKHTKAEGLSVCAETGNRKVFRFAHESVHQNLAQERVTVTVKVIGRNRVGVSSVDTLETRSLARCARAAIDIARHSPPQKRLPKLPSGQSIRTSAEHIPETARIDAATCATSIKRLFQICKGAGAQLAGSLVAGENELAVVNSSGLSCYARSTIAGCKLITIYKKLSGFASGAHRDFAKLDLDGLLKRSLSQSLKRNDPVTLPLGSYEVILEPAAVADLVEWLGSIAFGAKSVEERTSFLAGRIGEKVMDKRITLYDDGTEPAGLRMPFDYEGTPKRKVVLIDKGKAAGLVYDTTYGERFGCASTGHGMQADDTEGPLPLHLAMVPGKNSVDDMIRSCKRGVLIPRFHYVNGLLNPRTALMTGLTREGALFIEHGKRIAPIATLRFTQSVLEAFSQVIGLSKERLIVADPSIGFGSALMPTVHLANFRFTGRSGS